MYNADGKLLCLMPDLLQKVLTYKSDTSCLAAPELPSALLKCLILNILHDSRILGLYVIVLSVANDTHSVCQMVS
jgi:hypothetical protein